MLPGPRYIHASQFAVFHLFHPIALKYVCSLHNTMACVICSFHSAAFFHHTPLALFPLCFDSLFYIPLKNAVANLSIPLSHITLLRFIHSPPHFGSISLKAEPFKTSLRIKSSTVESRYTGSKSNGNPSAVEAKDKSRLFAFSIFVKLLRYYRIRL